MNGSSYLALQAWFTTMFTAGLNFLLGIFPSLDFFKPLSPGFAVGISHLCILLIAAIGIPSVNDIRLNRQIVKTREYINKCLMQPGISDELKKKYEMQLLDLDTQILKNHSVKIESIQMDNQKEFQKN
ncbi:hypothetical protein [Serratia nevei]|uniref:hypothetical protein n=1 Tax=Serratia nevei TaxID=2703794 RepID=UPI003D35B9B5